MPITHGYTTLATLKARLGQAEDTDDAILEQMITAVSRDIDGWCRRRFYAETQTRYFQARRSSELMVDDLLSITTLKTDNDGDRVYETTWSTTDFDLEPANAQLESQPEPYWLIRVAPNGRYSFPCQARGVEIAGSWGYSSSTPAVVAEACLLQAQRQYAAKNMPQGVSGGTSLGVEMRKAFSAGLHPFVRDMLEPFRIRRAR